MCVDYLVRLLGHIYASTCTTHFHFRCRTHVIILSTIDCTSKLIDQDNQMMVFYHSMATSHSFCG
jgi:hypothetical protein